MRVLVTGASGFTGGHLARSLARRGDAVRVLVRKTAAASALAADGVEAVEGDLLHRESLRRACEGVEVVYNIAALYREAGLPDRVYYDVNANAVGGLISAAAAAGARRVVHCSTVGVHGDVEHPPAAEDAPLRPGDVYQRSKVEGERIARETAAQHGIELVIARPSGIYGAGDRRLLKVFRGVARRRFVLLGDGSIYYHLTYIDDLVDGFVLCGGVPTAAGRTYILAGPEAPTLRELIRVIAEAAGVPDAPWRLPVWPVWIAAAACELVCRPFGIEPPLYRRRVDFFTKSRAFSIERARTELGYAPRVHLDEGVRRTLAWYREHGWI